MLSLNLHPLDPPISLNDYAIVFGNPVAERVLDDLKALFHFQDGMYSPRMDAMELCYLEGQRSVVLWLLHSVAAALENPDEVPSETTEPEQPQEGI